MEDTLAQWQSTRFSRKQEEQVRFLYVSYIFLFIVILWKANLIIDYHFAGFMIILIHNFIIIKLLKIIIIFLLMLDTIKYKIKKIEK